MPAATAASAAPVQCGAEVGFGLLMWSETHGMWVCLLKTVDRVELLRQVRDSLVYFGNWVETHMYEGPLDNDSVVSYCEALKPPDSAVFVRPWACA